MSFGDSLEFCRKTDEEFDIIYIDTMFPKTNKKNLPKKEMQYLQALLDQEDNTKKLLDEGLKLADRKVILKRPLKAVKIKNPHHSILGKAIRYDVYSILS